MVIPAWFGVFAPGGLPANLQDRLDEIILASVRTPDYQKTMTALALDSKPISKAAFAKFVANDAARWKKIAEHAKISIED
jgi:tripartite-type tricarboxylate transporter receptor subunit TctC